MDKTAEQVKPCPFCGGEGQTDFIEGYSYIIECFACRAQTGSRDTETDAISAWNLRAPVAAPQQAQPAPEPLSDERILALAADNFLPVRFPHEVVAFARALLSAAQPPAGYVLVPDYRGYAHLGTGNYLVNHSAAGAPAELVISLATDEEKAGRKVGDEQDNIPGDFIQPEVMCVRIRFENVAGLDVLESQLRYLRETHFLTAGADHAE